MYENQEMMCLFYKAILEIIIRHEGFGKEITPVPSVNTYTAFSQEITEDIA